MFFGDGLTKESHEKNAALFEIYNNDLDVTSLVKMLVSTQSAYNIVEKRPLAVVVHSSLQFRYR